VSEILPVEALAVNQSGRVVEIVGPSAWQHRLEELGLSSGKLVRLIQGGEPCIIGLNDQRLSLRCEPGTMLLVEVCPDSEAG